MISEFILREKTRKFKLTMQKFQTLNMNKTIILININSIAAQKLS